MTLGLLTCRDMPALTPDDQLLLPALKAHGIPHKIVIWSEPPPADVTHLLIRSPWDYHLKIDQFLDYLRQCSKTMTLLNSLSIVEWNYNKTYLKDLKKNESDIVDSIFVTPEYDRDALQQRLLDKNVKRIVLKPVISGSSYLTFSSDPRSPEIWRQLDEILRHSDAIIQPHLDSIHSHGEVSLMFFRGDSTEFSHAVLKTPKKEDFRVQADFGGNTIPVAADPRWIQKGLHFLESISEPWLYARVDLVELDKDPLLSELEMIEPALYFAHSPSSVDKFVSALKKHLI